MKEYRLTKYKYFTLNEWRLQTDHDAGRSIGQWTVAHVRVAGDPADVGRTPEHVVVVIVKDVFERRGRVNQVAGLSVQHTLWLTGRTAERIFT